MSGHVRALIARMLWAGMKPDKVAHTTGERFADVQAIAAELRRTIRP